LSLASFNDSVINFLMKAYEYKHIVSFEETNLVGNVYYANFVRWQGRCREMFLYEHAPDVLSLIGNGLALFTVRVNCEYYAEATAFDELTIQMRLGAVKQNRITMLFEYWRRNADGNEEQIARGEQEIACMKRENGTVFPVPVPESLRLALQNYL